MSVLIKNAVNSYIWNRLMLKKLLETHAKEVFDIAKNVKVKDFRVDENGVYYEGKTQAFNFKTNKVTNLDLIVLFLDEAFDQLPSSKQKKGGDKK